MSVSLKYHNWLYDRSPQKIKIDGWAGENTQNTPQPWQCKSYTDAATYGLEVYYSWKTTCIVSCNESGQCHFDGDFIQEKSECASQDWEPFANFAPFYFGYVCMLNIQTKEGEAVLFQPHPKAIIDRTGTVPFAMPGLLETDWWPEMFFLVFKAPEPNKQYIFKEGDPIASFLVVPKNIQYDIQKMTPQEIKEQNQRQSNIDGHWGEICKRIRSKKREELSDNKYKVLSEIAQKEGLDKVNEYMDQPKIAKSEENSKDGTSGEPFGEVDEIIACMNDQMSDKEIEHLIFTYKRQKREQRHKRSGRLKNQDEWILGHKVERI